MKRNSVLISDIVFPGYAWLEHNTSLRPCPFRVITGNAHIEPKFSALPPLATLEPTWRIAASCQDRTPPASAPLGKKWMGGTARTPLLDISQGGLQVLLGQRDPELVAQHASTFVLAFKDPAFDFT